MALLSADDVLNKSFQTTKFRDGYDQDEVDDFLDEIVNTMRSVEAENEELKAKLAAAESRIAELSRGEAPAAFAAPEAPEVVQAPVAPVEEAPAPMAEAVSVDAGSAAGMLALAQKLHDQYVAEGREESDRIIADARSSAERIVSEAEGQRDATLRQLNDERGTLEHKIDELREYERSYRQRMKDYLERMLSGMESGDLTEAGI